MGTIKNYVLDTNVLLNDPTCVTKFGKHNVIIPLVVLEEVDNFKKGNSSLAGAARAVSRRLDELRGKGRFSDGVHLDGGGLLMIPNYKPSVKFTESSFKDVNDNIILQTCINLSDKLDGVTLVTEDINLRVRAAAIGIESQEHKRTKVQDTSFYQSAPKVQVDPGVIDSIYEDGRVDRELIPYNSHRNEYMILESGSQSALVVDKGFIRLVNRKSIYGLEPRSSEQIFAIDALLDPEIKLVVLAGPSGCGKTLLALGGGLEQSFNQNIYEKMLVSRPIVHMGNDLGYLPGSLEEKLDPWLMPIYDNLQFLHRRAARTKQGHGGRELMEDLKNFGKVEVGALSYIRGRSIPNQFVVVDESQNNSPHEMKTIVTRIGEGSKLVITGDPYQIDSPYLSLDNNGISHLVDRMRGEKLFAYVYMSRGERSELAELAAKKL